jgi:hypothetical protein
MQSNIRPALMIGDLVMVKKIPGRRDRHTYRVVSMTASYEEARAVRIGLGPRRAPRVPTNDGIVKVTIADREGNTREMRRDDLWRVPNQPKFPKIRGHKGFVYARYAKYF